MQEILNTFKNPPKEFRGKPFWAWNGKLEHSELRRQIRLMKKMGFGGFFMHSRVGLDTPYLSEQWFECIDVCLEEAKKQDMEAWLYDEDRWPSGAAGGIVTKNPDFRQRFLKIVVSKKIPAVAAPGILLATFAAKIDGSSAYNVRRIYQNENPILGKGESLITFSIEISGNSSWYNGYTYLDTMNPDAVKEFIRVTHIEYQKRYGKDFGKLVPGIFTDEPSFLGWPSDLIFFPWTPNLPQVFKERYGYDLIENLMAVFFDIKGLKVSQARYHYRDCITYLFTTSFSRQIGQWCDENNILFTGHCLAEETPSSQGLQVGSAMRFYEHQQAPGMDILTQYSREYDTAKQVSSVAHQFGCTWRLSETYGCTGWDFPFEGHKAVGDWQTALGINLRCQHLAYYTMQGEAKRDYPAAIFYQSTWWEYYGHVEDYFSRIHTMVNRGTEIRDILVIHPIESQWFKMRYKCFADKNFHEQDKLLVDLRDTLLGANLDFDYGEEEILGRHGCIEVINNLPKLFVNKAAYSTVVVPQMTTMRATTLKLLTQFIDIGGAVIFAGTPPAYIDAVESDQAVMLSQRAMCAPASGAVLADAVSGKGRRISMADEKGREINGLLHLLTESSDAFYLFVCNTGHAFSDLKKNTGDTHIDERNLTINHATIKGFVGCTGTPLELDPATGAVHYAQAKKSGKGWEINTSFTRLGSRLFVIPKTPLKKSGPFGKISGHNVLQEVRRTTIIKNKWEVTFSEQNVLVLDRPYYTIGKSREKPPCEILRIDNAVLASLGMKPRGGGMLQPWAQEKPINPPSVSVQLRYVFQIHSLPTGQMLIAIESSQLFTISVNGQPLAKDSISGWWTDRSLGTIAFDPSILRLGHNEITISGLYDTTFCGLEIVYLLGNFGVKLKNTDLTLTAPVEKLTIGNWCTQGLPFYSGSVGYRTTIHPKLSKNERLFVAIPRYRGTALRIIIDGKSVGIIGWEPNEMDITDYVTTGKEHTLTIEVIGHRRNSHGPHHHVNSKLAWTGPAEYRTSGKDWQEDYLLVEAGLMSKPQLIVRKVIGSV